MRFIHLSDLHIGKRVNDFSMLEDQKYVFEQVFDIIKKENIDGVIIAGDIYDKAVASADAVEVYDKFITTLADINKPVFIISGNHDSAQRISFASKIMKNNNIYIAPVFNGKMEKVTLEDEYGYIDVYMLPFVKPVIVKKCFELQNSEDTQNHNVQASEQQTNVNNLTDSKIENYTQAVKAIIDNTNIDKKRRNIIIAHQFVTGAKACGSEELMAGGLDNVDISVFEAFDYTALGHIHRAQKVGKDNIRYCGTLLKYSFSEINHKKSVTIVDIGRKEDIGKCDIDISLLTVKPLHDMRHIKGEYNTITDRSNYINTDLSDYMYITLTDEEDVPDALAKLRSIYPNIMKLDYDNTRTRNVSNIMCDIQTKEKTPVEIISDFYEVQNGQPMIDEQKEYINQLINGIWENKYETN